MTPFIYPGLNTPKSQLFFDLQAFIAQNGGRFELIKILVKESQSTVVDLRMAYTANEVDFIKNNYHALSALQIAFALNKPVRNIREKINYMQLKGELKYKMSYYGNINHEI